MNVKKESTYWNESIHTIANQSHNRDPTHRKDARSYKKINEKASYLVYLDRPCIAPKLMRNLTLGVDDHQRPHDTTQVVTSSKG